jgi:hypothetical protein
MLPGIELAFEQPVTDQITSMFRANTSHTVAIFRQINKRVLHIHHDALEFPDGEIALGFTDTWPNRLGTLLSIWLYGHRVWPSSCRTLKIRP